MVNFAAAELQVIKNNRRNVFSVIAKKSSEVLKVDSVKNSTTFKK